MDREPSIKIRTLPRADEDAKKSSAQPREQAGSSFSRHLVNFGIVACCALMAFMFVSKTPKKTKNAKVQSAELTSVKAPATPTDLVSKFQMEAELKSQMLARTRQLENLNSKSDTYDTSYDNGEDHNNSYGVQFDQEDTASRVFDDLHDSDVQPSELLPGDRINARLAKNKWTNELERNERVTFVREFIKSAYEKGYEVQLDQNLVVVGVKKIGNQKVSIDQVLNKLAKQGL